MLLCRDGSPAQPVGVAEPFSALSLNLTAYALEKGAGADAGGGAACSAEARGSTRGTQGPAGAGRRAASASGS